jgi:hypothetical protein
VTGIEGIETIEPSTVFDIRLVEHMVALLKIVDTPNSQGIRRQEVFHHGETLR